MCQYFQFQWDAQEQSKKSQQWFVFISLITKTLQTRIKNALVSSFVLYNVQVHFLASEEASFTTGQCLDISGGRSTY
jgi:hypothetical protein